MFDYLILGNVHLGGYVEYLQAVHPHMVLMAGQKFPYPFVLLAYTLQVS